MFNTKFSEDLFLRNETGKYLYNKYAKDMPIIDYHCHLIPQEICENKQFVDLGEMWLAHDHYKWRAMRTFGIDEKYITGDASFYEKYKAFAKIMPELIGNPVYIWCALELKRYFGIEDALCEKNADEIYNKTKKIIEEKKMTPQWCIELSNVETLSTTDDPIDSLEYHTIIKNDDNVKVNVLPAFRPDKAFYCEKAIFPEYIRKLSQVSGMEINNFNDVMTALEKRLVFFKDFGTMISDNGIEDFTWREYTEEELNITFNKAMLGEPLTANEINSYRTAFLYNIAEAYNRNGFVMQLHIGTYKGANKSKENLIGIDKGFDCIDDTTSSRSVGELLNRLTINNTLPKTILYPLDGTNIESWAVLAAGFCYGGTRAKVQLGAPWWFNDQSYGIERQFEATANLYPVSLSVGMLTDSRSFLSYPRHELYRRVLCTYFGDLIERGEYFSDEDSLKTIIQNMCYGNAKEFFNL